MADFEAAERQEGGTPPAPRTPPYISYSTLLTFLGDMKEHGIPPQVDRSVLTRFSGGVQSQLMLALRALGLLREGDRPTPLLEELVGAHETAHYPEKLKALLKDTYPYVFALNLMTATPSMFAKAFSDNLSAKEDVLRKCRTFFLNAAKDAGISVGPRIETAKFPRSRVSNPRKPSSKAVGNGNGNESQDRPAPRNHPAIPITEKALEYRLVDLMSEAADNPEVMSSIISVITFLKTKSPKTASPSGSENEQAEIDDGAPI